MGFSLEAVQGLVVMKSYYLKNATWVLATHAQSWLEKNARRRPKTAVWSQSKDACTGTTQIRRLRTRTASRREGKKRTARNWLRRDGASWLTKSASQPKKLWSIFAGGGTGG